MKNEQKPMPLEQLPDYINSLKAKGEIANCVVDMGMIKPEKTFNWSRPILAFCLILGFSTSLFTYNLLQPQELIVSVNSDIQTIEKIVAEIDNNAKVVDFTKKGNKIHEVKISTKKNKQAFLKSFNEKIGKL